VLRILAAVAVDLGAPAAQRIALDPGTMSVIGSEHDYRVIRVWNRRP
jgi:hypothetical protein